MIATNITGMHASCGIAVLPTVKKAFTSVDYAIPLPIMSS
jgi:hypothetical protein